MVGILMLAAAFTGCIGEDDEDKFVGMWVIEPEEEEGHSVYYTFEDDGTGYAQVWQDEQYDFEWEIDEGEGTITVDGDTADYRFDGSDTVFISDPDDPDDETRFDRVDPDDVDLPEMPDQD